MKIAALYARVSTDEQQSQNQLLELRRFAKARGYQTEEFIDHGISGTAGEDRRPALKRLMEGARRRQIDIVLCWDLSRFARSLKQLVDAVENFRIWNVGFTTLRENIDTSTANGRLVFHIFAGLAEFERELIRERTILGQKRAIAEGKTIGRPRIAVSIDQIRAWAAVRKDVSFREIAGHFQIGKSTVARYLSQKPPQKAVAIIVGRRS